MLIANLYFYVRYSDSILLHDFKKKMPKSQYFQPSIRRIDRMALVGDSQAKVAWL